MVFKSHTEKLGANVTEKSCLQGLQKRKRVTWGVASGSIRIKFETNRKKNAEEKFLDVLEGRRRNSLRTNSKRNSIDTSNYGVYNKDGR